MKFFGIEPLPGPLGKLNPTRARVPFFFEQRGVQQADGRVLGRRRWNERAAGVESPLSVR